MGDGLLAEFASVVDALGCAVVLQREMAELRLKNSFNSREFREDMERAQRELSQSVLANNAELHSRLQAMVKDLERQNMYIEHCKDDAVKDKDKAKQKQKESEAPRN